MIYMHIKCQVNKKLFYFYFVPSAVTKNEINKKIQ